MAYSYASHANDTCRSLQELYQSYPRSHCTNDTFNSEFKGLLDELCMDVDSLEADEVVGNNYSRPMLWIGIYIAAASLFCILLMAADLFHGFRNRKLWFPSKYFTLNAASITVITIAMKLPVDLSSPMPSAIDQFAKVGSMTFMCTMMANLMPSLASMENRELFTNVAGMVILVVTMVVNILIQMKTGVVYIDNTMVKMCVYINIGVMLALLVLVISSALTIPTSKRILELKYQTVHKTTSNDLQHTRMSTSTIEELTQHVRKYWVMAGTCSPQFVMITTPLCSAAGIVCVTTTILHCLQLLYLVLRIVHQEEMTEVEMTKESTRYLMISFYPWSSDYKWSIPVIYMTQTVGIGVGTIALVFRCFAALNFKLSIKWIKKHTKVYEVEKHWTQMLTEWKKIHLAFPSGGHISKAIVYVGYNLILNLCIICQKVIVVSCKIIGLIPLATVIIGVLCVYCWKSLKSKFFAMRVASNRETIGAVEQNDTNEDIGNYALQLQDEVELSIRILKSISSSVNRSIQKAEKQLPVNLLQLIEQFTGFKGVVNFDSDDIQPLNCVKFPNSWSLPVVTLTCIAITLPNISQESVDRLFKSVCEGLSYTLLVEETLNNKGEYAKIQKATTALWREVEVKKRWLGNMLQRNDHRDKNPKEILEWFANKAEKIVVEMSKHNNEELLDDSRDNLIAADSMYRVTQTIMVSYPNDIEHNREAQLFGLLSGMMVDIMAACFTNLPRVIEMKCHEDAIEKREASVRSAAKLLGSTKKIIEKVQLCNQVPASLDPDQMAFIDEWRVHLKQSIP